MILNAIIEGGGKIWWIEINLTNVKKWFFSLKMVKKETLRNKYFDKSILGFCAKVEDVSDHVHHVTCVAKSSKRAAEVWRPNYQHQDRFLSSFQSLPVGWEAADLLCCPLWLVWLAPCRHTAPFSSLIGWSPPAGAGPTPLTSGSSSRLSQ